MEKEKELVEIKKRCNNCRDFKMCGKEEIPCEDWYWTYEYFKEIMSKLPWYIKEEYDFCDNVDEFIDIIEFINGGGDFILDIYDVIMHTLKINDLDLSQMVGVKRKVLISAMENGAESKYIEKFSEKLNLPVKFFKETTHRDIEEIENLLLQKFDVKSKKKAKNKKKKKKK
ncbi:hypothetical protein [Clostridium perfringens]|uniref:Uncharacterized protein n=1 Tax=Clostridium perfringens E str. JGS1987 TaxID=451755 RepID=B1BY46_CLOPF|nr:hypothetical protein [Clostridium perfringens]EDT13370.1 hypothetical protein AC3_A0397 [Clostridium perfringens E str. JGS1987]EDT13375.1 hypothetical protein AC3_A0381 [Clostridium perfringens E str. JGS1987]